MQVKLEPPSLNRAVFCYHVKKTELKSTTEKKQPPHYDQFNKKYEKKMEGKAKWERFRLNSPWQDPEGA